MGETLAAMHMHWIGEVDGRDIEFVLAPAECKEFKERDIITNILGKHCMWVLDFEMCQVITMDIPRFWTASKACSARGNG
jgi:hypothetical protein